MALDDRLANDFSALSVSDPEFVLFQPAGGKAWLQEKLDDIPRYLFRVFTPKSRGETNRYWTKSKDARDGGDECSVDILARDDYRVADMLNSHLRWWPCHDDNFVSWTSSLLFALQYVFYLRNSPRDGSTFDEIKICIIDTTCFRKGVFLRDKDLIKAYHSFGMGPKELGDLWNLRSKKHRYFAGSYYFGEYLSQGALRIEDKCDIVSAQALINHGLFDLQPEFEKSARGGTTSHLPPWANEVIRLREVFYERGPVARVHQQELQAAISIAQLFAPHWRLPVAANFIALFPRRDNDKAILCAFQEPHFTGSNCRSQT